MLYQLTPEELLCSSSFPGCPSTQIEQIQVLGEDDQCWLEIFSFSSDRQADGFVEAAARLLPEQRATMLGAGQNGFFAIVTRYDKPSHYGLITYHGLYKTELFDTEVEARCSTTIDRNGVVTEVDPQEAL